MPRVPLSRSISSSRTVIHGFRYTTRELSCRIVMASYRKQSLTRRELPLSAVWHYAYVAESADLVVVGLGAVGSAALYQAAKQGARVIGIDRFTPPHDQGSSHGE